MSDVRIIVWFTWFLATNWLQPFVVLFKEHIAKGVNAMKKTLTLILPLLLVAVFFLGLPSLAAADDDPPGRVARLNYIQGSVSYQPAGEQDWVDANPNRPLTTGDDLWADRNSRGEIHIGSTAIRLGNETGISFLNLDDRTVQLQLAQGVIEVHVRHLDSGEAFEIDTPNLAFTVTRAGVYHIKTSPDGDSTVIIVREGAGEVTGGGQSWELGAGGRFIFRGTDELNYEAGDAPGTDDFENWCQQRDQRENRSLSSRYVSRDMEGAYDLDDHGDWRDDSDYGSVWYPRGVAVGWAPYHYGHWVWINPWGWTWVGDESWGFAPYHYGRWVFVGERWGWVPGPVAVRPVYAPHLVAFVGGGGLSVAVGIGGGVAGVAWFPLGPRDVWVPAYRASPRYVQNINVNNTRVVNVTQVTNVYNTTVVNNNVNVTKVNYTYANQPGAVTAVRREDFVAARSVSQTAVKVTPEQIQNARPVSGSERQQLAPTRASYVAATAKPAPPSARPAVAFTDRKVVAKINPPPPAAGARVPTIVNAQKPPAAGTPRPGANKDTQVPPRGNAAQQPPPAGAVKNAEPPARGNTVQQPPPAGAVKNAEPPARGNTVQQPPPAGAVKNAEPPARGNAAQQPPPAGAVKNAEPPARGNAAQQPPPAGAVKNTEPPARGNTVQQPPPAPTNDQRPPGKFTPPSGGNKNAEPPARGNTVDQPPSRGNRNAEPPARGNTVQQPPPPQKNDARPPRDAKPTPPPKQEERRVEPPPKQEAHPQPPPKQESRPAPPAKEKEKEKGKDKEKEKDKESQPPRGWR